MKRSLRLSLVVGVALLSGIARAQIEVPGAYLPLLDAGQPLPGVTGTTYGWADIALNGWQFPYFGQSVSTIGVNAQGFVIVGSGAAVCGCVSEQTGSPAANVGPGCEMAPPITGCDPTLPQCGGGCCALGNNCQNFSCGGGCCLGTGTSSGCSASSANSNALLVSPFADSELDDSVTQAISYLQGRNDAGHFLTVDYDGVASNANLSFCGTPPCGASTYQFQVTLQESGVVTFSYGQAATVADAGGSDTSTLGNIGLTDNLVNPGTSQPDFFSAATCCTNQGPGSFFCGCGASNWQPGTVMIFGGTDGGDSSTGLIGSVSQPSGPYLIPQPTLISGVVLDGGAITFNLSTELVNVGSAPASGKISYLVYLTPEPLSVDLLPACSGGPPCLQAFGPFTASIPVLTTDGGVPPVDAGPTLEPPTSFTVANPPFGVSSFYYAEVWVDPADALATANPRASVAVSAPLAFGVDLTGSIGNLPGTISASRPLTIPLTLENLGLSPDPNFTFQVYLTAAPLIINPQTDFLIPPGQSAGLGPQGSLDLNYVGDLNAIPNGGVPLGTYYVTLSLPTQGDLNPLNNVVSAGPVQLSPAHLVVSNVIAPAEAFPGLPTDVSYTLANTGADDAPTDDGGFTILTLIHPQTQGTHFNRNLEPQLQELDGVTLKAGCTAQIKDAVVVSESSAGCAFIPPVPDGGARPVVPAMAFGSPLSPGNYLVGVYADPFRVVKGSNPNQPSESASPTVTVIALPAPDYTVFAGDLLAPPTGVAGEPLAVQVTISNIGIVSGATPYGFYLSAVGEVNTGGIPVPVLSADGGFTYRPTTAVIPYQGSGQPDQYGAFDQLLLPSGMPAGTYTLTVAIDPDQTLQQLSRANDLTAAQGTIQVSADPLEVITATRLPSAEVNVAYSEQLAAAGGLSGYQWALVGGALPAGFTLSAAGVIAGTPPSSAVGNYSALVQVTSGGQTQTVALLLAVTDGSAPLQILTPGGSLPPATVGLDYEQQLAAQGGVPPYTWTGNPPGSGTIVLEKSGVLSGTPNPNSVTSGPQTFTVTVTDQIGNTAEAAVALDIVSPATLTITTDVSGCSSTGICPANLNPQVVGQPMHVAFTAVESGTHQFSWQFPVGQALPPGLSAVTDSSSQGDQSFVISGTPTQVGVFPFRLLVTDELEHSAERHFVLLVTSTAVTFPDGGLLQQLPDAVQGQIYPATKLTTSQVGPIDFAPYSGDLPPGLALASDGTLSGTCSAQAALRPYAFVVSATDGSGNQALLPYVISVDAPKKSGCSTGGGEAALVVALAGLWLSRRRRGLAAAGLLAALVVAGVAQAQASPPVCTYRLSVGNDPYVDVTSNPMTVLLSDAGPVPVASALPTSQAAQILPFPLPTPGGPVQSLYAWSNGAIADLPTAGATIQPGCSFPFANSACEPPDLLFAPWWGDLSVCTGSVSLLEEGSVSAGTAAVTVQWQGVSDDNGGVCPAAADAGVSTFSFQTKLFQNGDVEYIYGPANAIAGDLCGAFPASCLFAAGAEAFGPAAGQQFQNPSGIAALGCNGQCQSTSFPTASGNNFSVRLLMGADLQASALGVGGNVSLGAPSTLTAEIANVGASPAPNATLSVFFSTDGVSQGPQLGSPIAIPQLEACAAAQPVAASFTLPASVTATVGYLIGVISDPGDSDAQGKTIVSAPFNILAPESNYVAQGLAFTLPSGATSVAPGGTLSVSWTASNQGAAPHPGAPYAYFVSRASTITPTDLQLPVVDGGAPLNLQPGAQQTLADVVQIPASLPPGSFTIGVIIDPQNTFVEQSKLDNLAVAPQPLKVISPTLAVASTSLPAATLGVSYSQVLTATGGDGNYSWSSSSLPMPFALAADGTLSGAPLAVGSLSFSVTVTDGTQKTATATLSLTVNPLQIPLAIVTSTLPGAQVNVTYQVALSAIGGTPPYQWCGPGQPCAFLPTTTPPLSGVLPAGLGFSPDGVLLGVPESNGTYAFQVAVADSATPPNVVVSTNLPIHVTASGAVSVSTSGLPVAQLAVPYVGQLAAAGGTAPVTWTLLDARRLPSAPGDLGADLQGSLPAGLTLVPATGQIIGTPTAAGSYNLLLEVQDSSMPPETATDNVLLQILPSSGLQIENSSLPAAAIGKPYDVILGTNAVDPTAVNFELIDSAGHDTPASRETLPPGLSLASDGQLSGTPSAAGNFAFLVEATDGQGRIAIQAFFIPVSQGAKGGCSSGGGEPLWLLAFAAAGLWRRRRS